MANNNLLASDNFASGSLAAGWSVLNFVTDVCAVIAGSPNVTEPKALTNGYGQQWTGLVWPLDHTSEVTVASLTSEVGTSITLLTRWQFASVSGYEAVISNGSAILKSFTNGTGTTLTTATGLTFAAGDVWSFQAAGSLLTLYRNGALIAQALDVSYLSWVGVGAPGYTETSTVNITHAQVSSWRGYSAVQQDGIWAKEGIPVGLAPTSTDITSGGEGVATTSQILFEGNAQILSGTVYKIWFCGQQPIASNAGGNISYAESLDGVTWTRAASPVLTGYVEPTVWKNGSTYYMFAQPITGFGTAPLAVLTSPNGINWTLQNASAIVRGSAGTWDSTNIWGCGVVAIIAGTWYGLYYADGTGAVPYGTGLVTSSDGINWTKSPSNPVILNFALGQAFFTPDNGTTFYLWGAEAEPGRGGSNGYDPGVCVRYTVTNNFLTWANRTVSFNSDQPYEFLNTILGQSWINAIINIGGKAYAYATSGRDASAPYAYQISRLIAPASIAQIIGFPEDAAQQTASDNFSGTLGNWTVQGGSFNPLQIASGQLEGTTLSANNGMVYTATTFNANQFSQFVLNNLASGGSSITPTVRASTSSSNMYFAGIVAGSPAAVSISKLVSGVSTQIGPSVNFTPTTADLIRLQVVTGSDGFPILSLFQNGRLILQVQDYANSITSGSPGIYAFPVTSLTNAQANSFAAGNANVIPTYPSAGGQTGLQLAMDASLRNSGLRH